MPDWPLSSSAGAILIVVSALVQLHLQEQQCPCHRSWQTSLPLTSGHLWKQLPADLPKRHPILLWALHSLLSLPEVLSAQPQEKPYRQFGLQPGTKPSKIRQLIFPLSGLNSAHNIPIMRKSVQYFTKLWLTATSTGLKCGTVKHNFWN